MRRRAARPLFFIDLAMPRNIAPDVAGLANVFLYNLDDLAKIAEENLALRQAEIGPGPGVARRQGRRPLAAGGAAHRREPSGRITATAQGRGIPERINRRPPAASSGNRPTNAAQRAAASSSFLIGLLM
jgi:hypothetical protein